MGLAHRRDLMQRTAREATAKRCIDGRNAEGQGARGVRDPGGLLQGLQALAQLLDHALSLWRRE